MQCYLPKRRNNACIFKQFLIKDLKWTYKKQQKYLKNKGYAVIKENEEQDLLFDKFTAIKNELTAEESKLVGLDAILSNIRNGHTKYEDGRTGIVVHDEEYEDNPGIFKNTLNLQKNKDLM